MNSFDGERVSIFYYWWIVVRLKFRALVNRFKAYRKRRPHKSFVMTKRRDYLRGLEIGGAWDLVLNTFRFMRENGKIFRNLILLVFAFSIFLVGVLDSDFLSSLRIVLDETNEESGEIFGAVGKAGLIAISIFTTGGFVKNPNESQAIAIFFIVLFTWLGTVQLCRDLMFSKKRRNILREALYSCGAPIIPMVMLSIVIAVQSIPAMIAIVIIAAMKNTGFAAYGIESALFGVASVLLIVISTYWVMGSLFAMVIATMPGVYPFQALRISGDMMSQRRLKILSRVAFLLFLVAFVWMAVLIPLGLVTSLISTWFEWFENIPLFQFVALLLTSTSLVYGSVYLYILYRRIVDGDRVSK